MVYAGGSTPTEDSPCNSTNGWATGSVVVLREPKFSATNSMQNMVVRPNDIVMASIFIMICNLRIIWAKKGVLWPYISNHLSDMEIEVTRVQCKSGNMKINSGSICHKSIYREKKKKKKRKKSVLASALQQRQQLEIQTITSKPFHNNLNWILSLKLAISGIYGENEYLQDRQHILNIHVMTWNSLYLSVLAWTKWSNLNYQHDTVICVCCPSLSEDVRENELL